MDDSTTGIRDVTLLAVSVLLGIGLASLVPWLGLPIAAAGLAGLAYRQRGMIAAGVSAVGVAAVALLGVANVVFAAPAVTAVLIAITLLPRVDVQVVGAVLVGILTLAGIGFDFFALHAVGTTISAQAAKDTTEIMNGVIKSLGSSATPEVVTSLKRTVVMMQQAVWSTYFESAVLVAILVIVAIAWSARRVGRPIALPRLAEVDLSLHILWPFVVGVFALAISYGSYPWASAAGIVGLNLVLCSRTLFFIQGMSVAAGVLERTRVGRGGRILALAALAALDALTFAVTFAGLLDFWINFRKLPRDGAPAATVGEGPGD